MFYETMREACVAWVNGFNAIPQSLLEKLGPDEIHEITPPQQGDRVYIYDEEHNGEGGEVIHRDEEDKDCYIIRLDDSGEEVSICEDYFEVQYDSWLPMWGTMWTFGDKIDEEWVIGEYLGPHLQEMADCGFRIYEQEDLGLVFGIDGCGYDFFGTEEDPSHWMKLYKARGLHWHKEGATA